MAKLDEGVFRTAKVLPVIEIDDAARAVDMADALLAGGLRVIELTLRSDAAMPALKAVKAARPALLVGMGTVLKVADARAALDAGADFLVTPGATDGLLDGLAALDATTLPGVATMSEAMRALERGFTFLKFFPAEPSGGADAVKAFAGPLPQARFCPTGGIGPERAGDYLRLPNVVCVGGSWIAPKAAIARGDFDLVRSNAARAAAL